MQFRKLAAIGLAFGVAIGMSAQQTTVVVKPVEIHDVLVNPGIGFMTFQRFNGDALNAGTKWTEGFPIEYQPSSGTLENKDFPQTSIAYFRVYWRFLEPEKGVYNWEHDRQGAADRTCTPPNIDAANRAARDRCGERCAGLVPPGNRREIPQDSRRMGCDYGQVADRS